jgi:hypothetical protein
MPSLGCGLFPFFIFLFVGIWTASDKATINHVLSTDLSTETVDLSALIKLFCPSQLSFLQ